jgi:hypothetical protein
MRYISPGESILWTHSLFFSQFLPPLIDTQRSLKHSTLVSKISMNYFESNSQSNLVHCFYLFLPNMFLIAPNRQILGVVG